MVRSFLLLSIGASLFANSEYVPFSKFSENEQIKYNFIKVEKDNTEIIQEVKEIKKVPIRNYKKPSESNIIKKAQIRKPISEKIIEEYKNETILNDEPRYSKNSFSKDLSITPKFTYMYATSSFDGEEIEKTHEVMPEISFSYQNHSLKFNYSNINRKTDYFDLYGLNDFSLDSKWFKVAYLYKIYNTNIGLAYNNLKYNLKYNGITVEDKEEFPSIDIHVRNKKNNLVVEYGGFYGKNNSDINKAYEYYLNLGYRVFNNDNLVFTLGYTNTTVENDGIEVITKGPTIRVSSTF